MICGGQMHGTLPPPSPFLTPKAPHRLPTASLPPSLRPSTLRFFALIRVSIGDLLLLLILHLCFPFFCCFWLRPRDRFTCSAPMPVDFPVSGDDEMHPRGPPFLNFMDMGAYYHSCKRPRFDASFIINGEEKKTTSILKNQRPCSIDALPDECLFEILRRLPRSQDRSIASCVSKRWLMLLSSIRTSEVVEVQRTRQPLPDLNQADASESDLDYEIDGDGHLTRCLEAEEATDIRLSAIAVSIAGLGGLGKLKIRGNSTCKVTDVGLAAIGRLCPSMRILSLWGVPLVSDAGLEAIADGCPMLEELDLCQCPLISDKSLIAITQKCPNLTSLTIDSCPGISNDGLRAIGHFCRKLLSVSIIDCPFVGDKGVSSMVAFASSSLMKIKLQNVNISDVSLAVIGHYGKAVTTISLAALQNVTERGFWVMGNALNMVSLISCTISSCPGITDLGLEAIAKCCPYLKHLCLQKSCNVTDTGLKAFAMSARMLDGLQLEECNGITLHGVYDGLLNCNDRFKSLALVKCLGIRDISCYVNELPTCLSLRSLTIHDCPGFTNCSMAIVGKLCPNLQQINLGGLVGVTDVGLFPLIRSSESRLVKVNLGGCVSLSDASVSALVKTHGSSLKLLNLNGCKKITDKTLLAIAANCYVLQELDVSRCNVSDSGIAALASAEQLNLQILSLAGCYGVTKKSLQLLGKMKDSLKGLNLQQCRLSIAHGIGLLEEKLWWCDIIS